MSKNQGGPAEAGRKIKVKVEYQRGSCVAYYSPRGLTQEDPLLQEGTRFKIKAPGLAFVSEFVENTDPITGIITGSTAWKQDTNGEYITEPVTLDLEGTSKKNFGGWGLHVGGVNEWAALDKQEIEVEIWPVSRVQEKRPVPPMATPPDYRRVVTRTRVAG